MNVLSIHRVSLLQFLQDSYLNLARISIFGNGTNNLDSDPCIICRIYCLDYLAKGALAQQSDRPVCEYDESRL